MATRPIENLDPSIIKSFTVAATKSATKGFAVKHSGADDEVENGAAVGDEVIGIALNTAAAGEKVRVALWGPGVAPMKVGTGGITRGAYAKFHATGGTTATVGGGTTKLVPWGQALQAGDAGDYVGVNLSSGGTPTVGS